MSRYSRHSDDSGDYVLMPVKSAYGGSEYGGRGRQHDLPIEVNTYLGVPQGRPRAASTGGGVAPAIINIGGALSVDDRERGHSRSRSRRRRSRSSSEYSSDRSRSRHRRRSSRERERDRERERERDRERERERERNRRPSDKITEDDLPYKLRKELDFAKMSHREEEERKLMDRIKKEREDERKRWKIEEEEEDRRKKKEREAILLEAELERERKKKKDDDLRKQILKDEEERKDKEKHKKKVEEEEFERKVKEKFMNAGYSPEYIEEVLHKKKAERANATLAIDLHRPTFIKVNRKYLHPDTLDHYGLPWEWDARDEEFIIIKKYIDHSLQDELFEHTRRLKERKLITGPYVKETKTITTLTPNTKGYVKKGDKMYVVREKSRSRSKSPGGWLLT